MTGHECFTVKLGRTDIFNLKEPNPACLLSTVGLRAKILLHMCFFTLAKARSQIKVSKKHYALANQNLIYFKSLNKTINIVKQVSNFFVVDEFLVSLLWFNDLRIFKITAKFCHIMSLSLKFSFDFDFCF